MSGIKPGAATQAIFSVFLGLMVTAFVGVGVYTFHPPPERENEARIEELNREVRDIRMMRSDDSLTDEDRERLRGLHEERDALQDANREAQATWGRSTSIILVVLATLAMSLSLLLTPRQPVIGNGLMLGGVFSMLYGTGWIVASSTSFARFFVMCAALVVTLGLGYLRFARKGVRKVASEPAAAPGIGDAGLVELERRIGDLERRLDEGAEALHR